MADVSAAGDSTNLCSGYTPLLAAAHHDLNNQQRTIQEAQEELDHDSKTYAIHLMQEGKDNVKPCDNNRRSQKVYTVIHHWLYHLISFIAVSVLMLLAFWEQSAVPNVENDLKEKAPYIIIELVILTFIALSLALRLVWRGPKDFLRTRNVLLVLGVIVMFAEAFAILFRNQRHFRVTRAFRPFLLLDTHYMAGARRIMRQIIKCAKYIVDVMLILFFLIALASLIGFFLFSTIDPTYFETLPLSFVSTFIAVTTANHPDVFLEAYTKVAATPVFFAIFLILTSYCLINLLAVVVVKFKDEDERKYKKLFLRRRKALLKAYDKVVSDRSIGLTFKMFLELLRSFKPTAGLAEYEVMCIFKVLQQRSPDCSRGLTVNEFEHLYQCLGLKWEPTDIASGKVLAWYKYHSIPNVLQTIMEKMHSIIDHWLFNTIMMLIVIGNLLLLIVPPAIYPNDISCTNKQFCIAQSPGGLAGSFLFTLVYVTEVTTRLVLEGGWRYFRKWWNLFDFIIVYGSFICLCVEAICLHGGFLDEPDWLIYLVIVRPLKLIRILKLRRSYFHLVKIMSALKFRLFSIIFLMLCVLYTFAIIGMEVFGGEDNTVYPGCCENASYGVGSFYEGNSTTDATPDVYWINNFETLYSAFVTLYELLVVNNWFITMEGFVSTTSWAARIYFILFWVTNTIVLNVSTAYILDGFELFFTDLANKQIVFENYIVSGFGKHAYVELTVEDKELLDEYTPQQTCMKTIHLIRAIKLWWKRKSFNKQDWSISLNMRGVRALSDSDQGSLKYKDKLQEWRDEQDAQDKYRKWRLFYWYHYDRMARRGVEKSIGKAKELAEYFFT